MEHAVNQIKALKHAVENFDDLPNASDDMILIAGSIIALTDYIAYLEAELKSIRYHLIRTLR